GWFSLDLHVLSAPPAFVLSQDQTLREELVAPASRRDLHFELVLKVSPQKGLTRFIASHPASLLLGTATQDSRSRPFTPLGFQRPCRPSGHKKGLRSHRRPRTDCYPIVSECVLGGAPVSICRTFLQPPYRAARE